LRRYIDESIKSAVRLPNQISGYIDESINIHLKLNRDAFQVVREATRLAPVGGPAPAPRRSNSQAPAALITPIQPTLVRRSERTRRPKQPFEGPLH
jgi:hypothetical protein